MEFITTVNSKFASIIFGLKIRIHMNAYCLGENFSTLRITQTNILISIITMGIDYEMTPLSNQSY